MIRLKDILAEGKENKISLIKLTILMEKMLPELTKAQATKLTELCTEVHTLAAKFNEIPYTVFNHGDWTVLRTMMLAKLVEVKNEASKLIESDKVDVKPFIKALDEIIAE